MSAEAYVTTIRRLGNWALALGFLSLAVGLWYAVLQQNVQMFVIPVSVVTGLFVSLFILLTLYHVAKSALTYFDANTVPRRAPSSRRK